MRVNLLERVERLNARLAYRMTKPVHVKIVGWGGKRNIPIQQIRDFIVDVRALRNVSGFSSSRQTVQIQPKEVPALAAIVKKHGLRMEAPKKMSGGAINGFD